MHASIRLLTLAVGLAAVGCRDAIAPNGGQDLDVHVPLVRTTASAEAASFSLADQDPSGESPPPEDYPEEFTRPAMIPVAWTRATVSSGMAGAEAYMEYYGSHGDQVLSLIVLADGRQIATAPQVKSAKGWFIPIWNSLRTFSSIPIATTCGIMALASTQHTAENKLFLPSGVVWFFSNASRGSGNQAGELMCADSTYRPPSNDRPPEIVGDDGSGGGGGGGDDSGDSQPVYLSCWWKLTFEGDMLVDVEALSCTLISS